MMVEITMEWLADHYRKNWLLAQKLRRPVTRRPIRAPVKKKSSKQLRNR
jgi:hypothetical protein